jgi:hypothetical protein
MLSTESDERVLLREVDAWRAAELGGDTARLGEILSEGFVAIGPLGFILTKEQWLQRLSSGDLKYGALRLDDVQVHAYGEASVMTARETQEATYRGQPTPGQFRTMMVWVKPAGTWLLAGLQLSPLAPKP